MAVRKTESEGRTSDSVQLHAGFIRGLSQLIYPFGCSYSQFTRSWYISIWDSSMAQAGPLINLDLSLFEKYREPEHMTRNIQKDVLFSCRRRYVLLQCHLVGIQMSCDLNLADIWEEASTHSVSIFGRWHERKIPNWVNGALLDHQGKEKNYLNVVFCSAHGQIGRKSPQTKPGVFSPTSKYLVDILGRTDLHSESFHLLVLWNPDFQILRFPDFQIQGCQLACLVANRPEKPSGPANVDFLF